MKSFFVILLHLLEILLVFLGLLVQSKVLDRYAIWKPLEL